MSQKHYALTNEERTSQLEDFEKKSVNNCLCGIAAYFNPSGLKSKLFNFHRFATIARAQGLNLTVIELYNKEPEIKGQNCDQYKAIKLDEIMQEFPLWQKEALLNIGIEYLNKKGSICDNFAWLDVEVMFTYPLWIESTCKALTQYKIIQPFDTVQRLSLAQTNMKSLKKLSYNLENDHVVVAPVQRRYGRKSRDHGYVWAARKSIFEDFGLFAYGVVGGGDTLFLHALYNEKVTDALLDHDTSRLRNFKSEYSRWAAESNIYAKVGGNIGYLKTENKNGANKPDILHFFHGGRSNRRYNSRWSILAKYDFDPSIDIEISPLGYLSWSDYSLDNNSKFLEAVRNYFIDRREEDVF